MAARGDFQIMSEPFSDSYYYGPDRVTDRYAAEAPSSPMDFNQALDSVLSAAQTGPVFLKDMAYHVRRHIDSAFLENFTNVALVRDPRLSLVSLYKRMPDFSREETGFEALVELVKMIPYSEKGSPFVVDGERLRGDPGGVCRNFCEAVGISFEPSALEWKKGDEEHWNRWQDWFREASSSIEFRPPQASFYEDMLQHREIQDALEYCLPSYDYLRRLMSRDHRDRTL